MTLALPAPAVREPLDTIDLNEIASLLRRRAGVIISFVILATLIALLYVLLATPMFTAEGALYLGDAQSAGGGGNAASSSDLDVSSNFSNTSDVATQLELITATGLIQQAVLETGLNAPVKPHGERPFSFWRWQFGYGGSIDAFQPGPQSLQALFASTPGSYRIELGKNDSYAMYTRPGLLEKKKLILSGILGQAASGNGVQLLVQPAGAKFKAVPGSSYDLDVTSPAVTAQSLLAGMLTVTSGGSPAQPTKIAFLRLRYSNPFLAKIFVNQMIQDFISSQLAWKTQSASTTEEFISKQLTNINASLAAANKNLAEYQSKTGIVDVAQNSQSLVTQLSEFKAQRTKLLLQQEALQKYAAQLHGTNAKINPFLVSQADDTVLAGLTANLATAQVKLNQVAVQFTGSSQEYQVAAAEVGRLESSITDIVDNDLAAVNHNLASLDSVIAKFQQELKDTPAESLTVMSLQRSTDVLGKLYVLLMQKKQEAEVAKAATIINTRVVTAAVAPLAATSPKAAVTIAFGAFLGLLAGLGLVFGARAFSGRFESEGQIRSTVPLHVFGEVPRCTAPEFAGSLTHGGQNSPFLESFRLLRSSIYRTVAPGKSMIIMVVSAMRGEGQTTIAANLAKTLADDGRRVVMVDGGLHLVKLREQRKINALPGIEAVLTDIFANLREEYEFIIVDCPPLPGSADGMTLGLFADLILSVVCVARTSRRALSAHNDLLAMLGRPRGIVINQVEPENYGIIRDRKQGLLPRGRWSNWRAVLNWKKPVAGSGTALRSASNARSLSDWSGD